MSNIISLAGIVIPHNNASGASNDGYFVPWYSGGFDFTIVFENIFLGIIPTAIGLLAWPAWFLYYRSKPTVAGRDRILWSKLFCTLVILVFEIAKAVVWSQNTAQQLQSTTALKDTAIWSSVLSSLLPLAMGVSIYFDHLHSLQPSAILSIYLTISLIADVLQGRTLFLRPSMSILGGLSIAVATLKLALIILQEIIKPAQHKFSAGEKLSRDAVAGFWNHTFLFWINSTFFIGFRRHLSMNDLGSLGQAFSSKLLAQKFERAWGKPTRNEPHALAKVCFTILFWPFILTALPRLLVTSMDFASVFLLQAILRYLGNPDPSPDERPRLIVATLLVYLLRTVSSSVYEYLGNTTSTQLRGVLVGQVLQKNLRLPAARASETSALTHISADVEGILDIVRVIHELWIGILGLGVGLYCLWTIVGKAFFLPLIPITVSTFIGWYVGKRMGPATADWNQAIQDRLLGVSAIIAQVVGIKMLGLGQPMIDFVQRLREREIVVSKTARKIRIVMVTLLPINYWATPLFLILGGKLWTVWKDGLEPVSVFTALAFVAFLSDPVNELFNIWPRFNALLASFNRIQDFLNLKEAEDPRRVYDFNHNRTSESTPSVASDSSSAATEPLCIEFLDVAINSVQNNKIVLQNVNLRISPNTLNLVIGSVGTGKTALLKALIGETVIKSGQIRVLTKDIAYCGQSVWLPNVTIQQAIVGPMEFDAERFQTVIQVCSLECDISKMAAGRDSLTGPNGSKLSGGQKQRVALARAIYSLSPIVVCDDTLSSLDAATSKSVFSAVFGPDGFLRKQGRTVILATHATEWLSFADQVFVLENAEVNACSTPFAIDCLARSVTIIQPSRIKHDISAQDDVNVGFIGLEEEVETPPRATELSLYRFYFQDVPTWMLASFIGLIALVGALEKFPDIYIRIWIGTDAYDNAYLWVIIALTFAAMIVNGVAAWLFQIVIIPKAASKMHSLYVTAIMRATLPFLTSTNNGALLNRFGQDMTLLAQEMPMAFYRVAYSVAITVTMIAIVASGTTYTFILVPILGFILFLVQAFYLNTSRQLRLLDLEAKTPLYTNVSENSAGIEHIRTLGWGASAVQESLKLLDYSQKPFYYMYSIQRWLQLVLDMIFTVVAAVVVTIALQWTSTTSQPSLGLALVAMVHLAPATQWLIIRWTSLETSLGSILRLKTFIRDTPQEETGHDTKPSPDNWPSTGSVEFQHVGATYSANGKASMAIKGINLSIKPGEKVVVTGRTGSGKSSFFLSMLNFLKLEGTILIDGIDISKVPREQLRRVITTIPQDPVIIPGSIRENLLPCDIGGTSPVAGAVGGVDLNQHPITDTDIWDVLKAVRIAEYIQQRGSLDTDIKSMEFSSGQKQLIAIARAMVHQLKYRNKIILMDEFTSSLDYDTDLRIQQVLNTSFSGCTQIIISHRSTGIFNCDLVLTLKNGSLVDKREVGADGFHLDDEASEEDKRPAAPKFVPKPRSEPLNEIPSKWLSAEDTQRWLNGPETDTSSYVSSEPDRPDTQMRRKIKASIKQLRRAREAILAQKAQNESSSSQAAADPEPSQQRGESPPEEGSDADQEGSSQDSTNVASQQPRTDSV